jgi:hypothetical protein
MISFTLDKFSKIPIKDDVSLYVQEIGGHFEIQRHVIEFFVPQEYRDFIIMKYPFLEEVDYII